jgi:hypothetical protein
MSDRFCSHLQDYAVLFVTAEASYRQCVSLIDQIVAEGPDSGLTDALQQAVAQWRSETGALREAFAQLVDDGQLKLPRSRFRKARCITCRHLVPRLDYPEWKFKDDGAATFRGQELPVAEEAGAPTVPPAPVGG